MTHWAQRPDGSLRGARRYQGLKENHTHLSQERRYSQYHLRQRLVAIHPIDMLLNPDFAGIMEKECHQKKEKGLLAGKLWLNKEHNVPKEAHLFGEEFYEYHPQFLPRSRSL